jgi:hypothetical protein
VTQQAPAVELRSFALLKKCIRKYGHVQLSVADDKDKWGWVVKKLRDEIRDQFKKEGLAPLEDI